MGAKPGNRVIDDLELTLEPGTLTWIGGSNGVGKTTLLRVLAGLIGPTEGHVHIFGLHPEHDRRAYQRRLSFLSATGTGLYARLSVRQQIDYTARIAFVPRERRPVAVEESLRRFSLLELARHRVDRLSMGQRQRVRLAMTFIKEPDLVLLDEPRNSLDSEGTAMLVAAVREVVERGGAVLVVLSAGRVARDALRRADGTRAGKAQEAVSTLRLYRDAALGFMARDWTVFKSYRMQFFGQIASLFMGLALFYFLSRLLSVKSFGSHSKYFAYVVLGMIVVQVLQSTMAVATGLRGELVAGTFERILLSPFGGVAAVLSMMILPFCMSFVSAIITLFFGAVVFGLQIHWATAALAVPVAMLGTGAFTAFGLIFACSAILWEQVVGGAGLMMSGIALVSGLYFPIALLPAWLKWFSSVQPFTPTVELLRHTLVRTPLTESSVLGDLAKIVGFVVVFLPISVLLLGRAMRIGQRRGTIIEYLDHERYPQPLIGCSRQP